MEKKETLQNRQDTNADPTTGKRLQPTPDDAQDPEEDNLDDLDGRILCLSLIK